MHTPRRFSPAWANEGLNEMHSLFDRRYVCCFPLQKKVEYASKQHRREETVLRFIVSVAMLTLCIGTPNIAQAAAGCPNGYTPQDGVCKPYRGPYGPPGYGYGYPPPGYGYRYPAPPPRYFPPDPRYGARGCPSGYTIQGGWCKPYRGY
jgi:hypothetical protein